MDLSPDDDHFQGRLLHQAALWDNVELVEELVSCGAGVAAARDAAGRSALHAAALADGSRCLAPLCAAAPPRHVDARSDHATGGKTALHIAAERGHVENVRTLVAAGASLNIPDANGDTALALAERHSHRHAANVLREARDASREARERAQAPPEGADAAYDVTDYFLDEVDEPWRQKDALERERLAQHATLRALVCGGAGGARVAAALRALGPEAGLVANLTPGGANTLLYVACESGATGAVSALVEAGADGRAHPVTQYGPLYIAAYHGHLDIARLLLQHFPQAVQQETVEKWLPLHAACIGGHAAMVTLLLEYPYPESMLKTYTDARGEWRYRAAFDVNALDVSGQSALYIACTLGNLPVVDALLAHSAPAEPANTAPTAGDTDADRQAASAPAAGTTPAGTVGTPAGTPAGAARGGISLGIHAIVNRLTGAAAHTNRGAECESVRRVRPVRADVRRGDDSCVSCAARGDHTAVLRRLLAAGADPNAPAHAPDTSAVEGGRPRRSRSASAGRGSPQHARARYNTEREGAWSALAAACRARHVRAAEVLLEHGATDTTCRALRECAAHGLTDLMAKILATKAYPDPEHKLDRGALHAAAVARRPPDPALTHTALVPSVPAAVHWRDLRVRLPAVRMSWLRLAALHVNSKLASGAGALAAITRLDLADNELRTLPPDLFALTSIRYINVAANKLERLPSPGDPLEEDPPDRRRRSPPRPLYTAPRLHELYLQDNRLEEIPPSLFSLPSLTTLDVSNNKLRALPPQVWTAPALRDLNAALNHLKDLPGGESGAESGAAPSSPAGELPSAPAPAHSSPPAPALRGESAPDDDALPVVTDRTGHAVWMECARAHSWRGAVEPPPPPAPRGASPLQALNLSHNQFTCVPPPLACRAPSLTRLNMAYNCLRSMSYVTSYPTSLRQLDLSHNEITCWPSLPQVENFSSPDGSPLSCYCPPAPAPAPPCPRPPSGGSVRAQLLHAACPARRHLRLEGLRTLILSNNLLTRIQLTTDDDGTAADVTHDDEAQEDEEDWCGGSSLKGRLLFPLLSMLDVSFNLVRAVPAAIHALSNLAVLNISGNKEITSLPPALGLLSRLWSLSASDCALDEPLRSMVVGGRCRCTEVVGYLKSVLNAATKYSRMKLMLVGQQGIGKTSLLECLRQESAIQHRKKPTDHWAKRMGNKSSRRNMSTVGVDIGTWVYEKGRSTRGPVTFRTWDFGGQQEYYATHQYFLSRRSLYLVLWRATDGRRGLASALHWLRSIQARAPGSPVIMVATHYDQVANCSLPESESPESLQRLIRSRIMAAPDADKLGLPRVLDSIEVSCSTRHNIRLLADVIYSVAFSVKPPGSKEPLLEQRIPATYLALEECVTSLAAELPEPVLRHNEYKKLVTQYMQQKNHKMFRDATELHQATMFLHENGVLLHYDDATLKELYFLRPQWLCDVLAHVVTVREINPFAANGIMKVEDLAHVFKASPLLSRGEEAGLGLSLLHKFELALCWDSRALLVPSLLPAVEPAAPQLWVRGRGWPAGGAPRPVWPPHHPHLAPLPDPVRPTDSPTLIHEGSGGVVVEGRGGAAPLRRLLLVTYVPRGFWARLCTRLLGDPGLARAPHQLYRTAPSEVEADESIARALEMSWGWKLWRRGLKLVCGALTLLSLKELPPKYDALLGWAAAEDDYTDPGDACIGKLRVQQEGAWCTLDVASSACIEILLPAQVAVARRDDGLPIAGYQSISLEPNPEVLARVLALVSDHVDLLLEDWYPSLGTRFVHTSEGRCLITRLVPCPACLRDVEERRDPTDLLAQQASRRLELGAGDGGRQEGGAGGGGRLSQDSRASDGDSGVGNESNASSRLGSVEGVGGGGGGAGGGAGGVACAWTVEQCILCACAALPLHCPHHADVRLRDVAPDTLLLDVEDSKRARWEHISRTSVAGRGAFGTVLAGAWRPPAAPWGVSVAIKALQPVPPPPGADVQAHHAYKAAVSRWERDPTAGACRAYCGLRQELSILSVLRHPHVVPLLAVCCAPLALLLPLAPMGSLEGVVREYRSMMSRVRPRAARALLLQVARALEHLHDKRIVYRDLKSENVLVWRMPRAAEAAAAEEAPGTIDVHVKLGDYGISRLAPPSGTKGFGGTEGFMAPEIMRYNGEEEYNEKVDCFSFGMLVYEVVTGRQPFEGHEAVKEAVLEGARPPLSPRELEYPCCVLETMRRCWAGAPSLRPSAAALVSVLAAPECITLRDAAAARAASAAAAGAVLLPDDGGAGWEVWFGGGEPERVHTVLASSAHLTRLHTVRVPPDKSGPVLVTALCRVGACVWAGDSAGRLHVYDASSCALLWSVKLQDAVGGAAAAVSALQPLATIQRVALSLTCGRLFVVTSQRPAAEGTFVLTELGTATELCCLAAVPASDGYSVWAGGDDLCAYSVSRAGVSSADCVPAEGRVAALAAGTYVFGYCDPGVFVYQWDVSSKQQTARLDCSKLVPCSESLRAIDDVLARDRCTVTSLAAAGALVFAGTAGGCLVVADGASLRPLTVCRPYEADVVAMVPLVPPAGAPLLATLGRSYRPLLQRYAPIQTNNSTGQYSGYYCLLWQAQHWLPD